MRRISEKIKRFFESEVSSFDIQIQFEDKELNEVLLTFQGRTFTLSASEWDELCDLIGEITEEVKAMYAAAAK